MDCLPTRKRGKKTKILHPLLKERHAKKTKQKKKRLSNWKRRIKPCRAFRELLKFTI
jgi:hypothetical protein